MRIFVVDDDDGLREAIVVALRASGFATDAVGSIAEARVRLGDHSYDCMVLDRRLPDGDGLSLLGEEGRGSMPPTLALTARDSIRDRVEGFDRGVDDYLVKPFAMAELIARIRMLCRRRAEITAPQLLVGNIELDAARREVRRDRVLLSLTAKEYSVLELLMVRVGTVVSRETLIEHCWDELTAPMSNAVDVVVGQLRAKLGGPGVIHTVRGAGYRIEDR